MSSFITKIGILFCCYLTLIYIARIVKGPYYGNTEFESKYQLFHDSPDAYNSVVFGSSHVYRQFNPIEFDRKTKSTSTYNFGGAGCFGIETLYLVETFLSSSSQVDELENIIVEFQIPRKDMLNSFKTVRNQYYMSMSSLNLAWKYQRIRKEVSRLSYALVWMVRTIGFQTLAKSSYYSSKQSYLSYHEAGYFPLDVQQDLPDNISLTKRKKKFDRNIEDILEKRKVKVRREVKIENSVENFLFDKLLEIANKPEHRHLNFYVLVHPLNKQYKQDKFGKLRLLQMDWEDLDTLISQESNYFDRDHLNSKGATNFSKAVAKKFAQSN